MKSEKRVRVLCSACISTPDRGCRLCEGRRYYLFERSSSIYLTPSGAEIPDSSLPPTARLAKHGGSAEISEILSAVERWAARDARRRFKLWYEDGWNCYIWPNRYKPKLFEASDPDLGTCLADCWSKLKAASRRSGSKRPSSGR